MNIKTKYNIGDYLYIPYTGKDNVIGKKIIIKHEEVINIIVKSENDISYIFNGNYSEEFERHEPFVFNNIEEAKEYAIHMINKLAKTNRKEIRNFGATKQITKLPPHKRCNCRDV